MNEDPSNIITVNARKFDQSIRRSWQAAIVSQSETEITLVGTFERSVVHGDLGDIEEGTVSFEFFWPDRWFNVFRFHRPDGEFRNYYCNIAMPPTLSPGVLDYVDLDIDVVVWPDRRVEVLDREDFEINARLFGYPDHVLKRAESGLAELLDLIASDGLPKAS